MAKHRIQTTWRNNYNWSTHWFFASVDPNPVEVISGNDDENDNKEVINGNEDEKDDEKNARMDDAKTPQVRILVIFIINANDVFAHCLVSSSLIGNL